MITLNNKEVFDIEVDGVNLADYPDLADVYICSACYADGTDLTDDELIELQDKYDSLAYEIAYESIG